MVNRNTMRVTDDDIVITGMSGRFPESDSIEEFAQNLFNGVDMVTADDRRWTPGLHGLPERNGKLKNLTHFDATFFGVHAKQAHVMDPQQRLLLESTYEAIVDSGYNPAELRGSRTACFVGVSKSESEEIYAADDPDMINGYALTGCLMAMFPNRISYTFDFKGPSYAIDTGCSSSMSALVQAVAAMKVGHCEAVVVAGTNLCLNPIRSLNFHRLGMQSMEGRCAAFDANGNGYVRSEGVVVILLQRRADARRIYATVRGARMNNDGYKTQGITFPTGQMQYQLSAETFEEAQLQPKDVVYVEAHGTGTKVGDPQEVNALADFFCKDRKTPLLLGSVKSNMGHSEPAAGLCSLVKVLIAMERGIIPGNLHYKSPNVDIPALLDGSIKVVDRNTPWNGGLVAVNSFGFGGANAHAILKSEPDVPRTTSTTYSFPRLVLASGRTTSAVRALLGHAKTHAADVGLHALLDAVHAQNIPGHAHRGYVLLGDVPVEEIVTLRQEMKTSAPRPVWFVFSGMGSQAPCMARTLMRLPVFAASIQQSATILQPHGINLIDLLTEASDSAFEDVINSFVTIVAVQVALVDVLRAVGVHPDRIIGHSVGELSCAYADDTLTAEQTVLAAYWRGRSIVDAKLPPGAMAAVGLTWEQCLSRCPPDITPVCHNSEYHVTISGSKSAIESFVAELMKEGVFARRINTSGVAFHSQYIAAAAPLLRAHLETLIPSPKPRTTRWLSTSLPKDQWNSEIAKLSDAQYHVNNLLSPVLFAETLRSVPKNALLVEVAPHALLQAILKVTLPESNDYIALVHRESPDTLSYLLSALGKIYCAGAQVQPGVLYPAVTWPVPRGTPGLASYVQWDHTTEWSVARFGAATHRSENVINIDLSKSDDSFLSGRKIDGQITFSASGYIMLVWRTVAKLREKKIEETGIVINDIQFKRDTIVTKDTPVRFIVNILEGTGEFNVCEGGSVVVSGKVRFTENPSNERLSIDTLAVADSPGMLSLNADDIYKELRLRGYNYSNVFRGIRSADASITIGELNWNDNWVSFMDTMLQFNIISNDSRTLRLPTYIQSVVIDPKAHLETVFNNVLTVRHYKQIDLITSGGIEYRGITMSQISQRLNTQPPPKLEKYIFLPYDNANISTKNPSLSKRNALTVTLQLVLENVGSFQLKVTEAALDRSIEALLAPHAMQILEAEIHVRVKCSLAVTSATPDYIAAAQELNLKVNVKDINQEPPDLSCHLVLAAHVMARDDSRILMQLVAALDDTGMLLLEETHDVVDEHDTAQALERAGLVLMSRQVAVGCNYVLLRKRPRLPIKHVVVEIDEDDQFRWVEPLRGAIKRAKAEPIRVYVVSYAANSGVLGLTNCLRGEPGGHVLRVFHLPEVGKPFSPTSPIYEAQVNSDLAVNVLRAGTWGSYRLLLLDDVSTVKQVSKVEHAYVNTLVRGDLSSVRWIESPLRYAKDQHQGPVHRMLCYVYYAPLKIRDVMFATGKLPPGSLPGSLANQDCILALEFSGRSSKGERVMGMVEARALSTSVMVNKDFLWEVPKVWTLEQAATVPVAYATAYYALMVRGCMKRGETVLVHAGAGGVGQAAITIALHAGCRVFTTVSTPEKRAFLLERFPLLNAADIGNSCDTSFEQMVRRRTHGCGVDLVLNTLSGDKLLASVRCLAERGRFLEIGKSDLSNNTALGMAIFLKNTTFHVILLDALFEADDENADKAAVLRCMAAGLADGVVKPLPTTIFTENQLEQCFKYMASGKHIGKVLVRVREEETASPITVPNIKLVPAIRRIYFHPAKSYVLMGGLGGLGIELSHWLVKRGAKKLVLNSRSGVRTGYQARSIRLWREAGVHVAVSTVDVTTVDGASMLLHEANAIGPIGGIFNLAAVLRDALFENQTADNFKAVAKPKINSMKVLDTVTRELAPKLDYFVTFSSFVSGRGNPGQANYGYANSATERICEERRAKGLLGLAIQWGPIGEVGLVMETSDGENINMGLIPQRVTSFLKALDSLLLQPHAVVSCVVLEEKHLTDVQPQQNVVDAIADILGIKNPKEISDTVTLAELGIDSLMAAEVKLTLERVYNLVFNLQEVLTLTFTKLREATFDTSKTKTASTE